jgi:hypothetical protein
MLPVRPVEIAIIAWSLIAVRTRTALLVGATLTCLSGCGQMGAAPNTGQPTTQGQAMRQMLADVDQVRAFVYGGGSQPDAEKAATNLVAWSQRISQLFPPGQATTDYVDMSPERVRGAPEAMQRTATALLAAVQTGSRSQTGDRLTQTEKQGCGFCHLSGTR